MTYQEMLDNLFEGHPEYVAYNALRPLGIEGTTHRAQWLQSQLGSFFDTFMGQVMPDYVGDTVDASSAQALYSNWLRGLNTGRPATADSPAIPAHPFNPAAMFQNMAPRQRGEI